MGFGALLTNTTGANNTALGYLADVSTAALSNATAIGANAKVNASNKIRFGSTTVTKVEGPVSYTVSDGRFKKDVQQNVIGLEFIKRLRPVTYTFDTEEFTKFLIQDAPDSAKREYLKQDFTESKNILHSGFIAQEVEKAAKEVGYNFNGVGIPQNNKDNYSLAYAQFVMPLVQGMQEQQAIIEKLQNNNEQQQKQIDELKELVNKLANPSGVATTTTTLDNSNTLSQNTPNPFAGETTITYTTSEKAGKVEIAFADVSGKRVKVVPVAKGQGQIKVSANDLKSGMYSYTLFVDGNAVATKTLIKN
jgi:type II secretory pathway pseudopilin PulG